MKAAEEAVARRNLKLNGGGVDALLAAVVDRKASSSLPSLSSSSAGCSPEGAVSAGVSPTSSLYPDLVNQAMERRKIMQVFLLVHICKPSCWHALHQSSCVYALLRSKQIVRSFVPTFFKSIEIWFLWNFIKYVGLSVTLLSLSQVQCATQNWRTDNESNASRRIAFYIFPRVFDALVDLSIILCWFGKVRVGLLLSMKLELRHKLTELD